MAHVFEGDSAASAQAASAGAVNVAPSSFAPEDSTVLRLGLSAGSRAIAAQNRPTKFWLWYTYKGVVALAVRCRQAQRYAGCGRPLLWVQISSSP
jgi:hypothetical protein